MKKEGIYSMSSNVLDLIQKHRAYYEVQPYYLSRVQAGFDVDVYGVATEPIPAGPDYAAAVRVLQSAVQAIAESTGSCSVEVISYPERLIFEQGLALGMLRIRISHRGSLDEPSGEAEARILKELERRLHDLGLTQGRRTG